MFNPLTGYKRQSTAKESGGSSTIYGRVVDVILDSFHPQYDTYGRSQAINGIFYRPVDLNLSEDDEQDYSFAFQGNTSVKHVPLKNEIVKIEFKPSNDRSSTSSYRQAYWTSIVPIWNHPHHNASPDFYQNLDSLSKDPSVDLGKYFKEEEQINPLQPFPGDVIIEGRQGQSIRFSGAPYPSNPFTDESNNNHPIIVLSNGQRESENGFDTILEDIDQDPNSLYFLSNHQIQLTQSNTKQNAFNIKPVKFNEFKGNQVVLNGGRIVFNAKEEDILLSAKFNFGVTSNILGLDAKEYIGLDSDKIFLGIKARRFEDEPVLLGTTTVEWLKKLVEELEKIVDTLSTLPPSPATAVSTLISIGNATKPTLKTIKSELVKLKSKKVFTE